MGQRLTTFRIGTAMLVRNGKFWYPARVLEIKHGSRGSPNQWLIQWWRGCNFHHTAKGKPNQRALVTEDCMRDSLWKKKQERRYIRVRHSLYIQ